MLRQLPWQLTAFQFALAVIVIAAEIVTAAGSICPECAPGWRSVLAGCERLSGRTRDVLAALSVYMIRLYQLCFVALAWYGSIDETEEAVWEDNACPMCGAPSHMCYPPEAYHTCPKCAQALTTCPTCSEATHCAKCRTCFGYQGADGQDGVCVAPAEYRDDTGTTSEAAS